MLRKHRKLMVEHIPIYGNFATYKSYAHVAGNSQIWFWIFDYIPIKILIFHISGSILKSKVVDVEVRLHEFTASRRVLDTLITACAATCVQRALSEATSILLEPMMNIEVQCIILVRMCK